MHIGPTLADLDRVILAAQHDLDESQSMPCPEACGARGATLVILLARVRADVALIRSALAHADCRPGCVSIHDPDHAVQS